jgi:pyruvate,orthophosphate dikinase
MSSAISKIFDWVSLQKKRVYFFHEGAIEDKNLLGSKGANLCEMFRLGLPGEHFLSDTHLKTFFLIRSNCYLVPPGFVVTTEACSEFFKQEKHKLLEQFVDEYAKSVRELEKLTGKQFGGGAAAAGGGTPQHKDQPHDVMPLLLSVRSGAATPIPGLMETVLNLGVNDELVLVMARVSNNPRWAYDTYRRFLQMYGTVVLSIEAKIYADILDKAVQKSGVAGASELGAAALQEVVAQFKEVAVVPQDPWEQLQVALESMFCSWFSPRAVKYRDLHGLVGDLGTAVVVQAMVYGNMNSRSGVGLAFTRSPVTGEKTVYGRYLANAEGEEVRMEGGAECGAPLTALQSEQPVVFDKLLHFQALLEKHYRDMQEVEFTVENGVLYVLESCNGKRTPKAAVAIAVSMVTEKLINEREALLRIDPQQMDYFLHPAVDPAFAGEANPLVRDILLGRGSGLAAGLASGKAVFSAADALDCQRRGEACILCKPEILTTDLCAMKAAVGVLTTREGLSSFCATTQREAGRTAVTGVQGLTIDCTKQQLVGRGGLTVSRGEVISIDGSSGLLYKGEVPAADQSLQDEYFYSVLAWADRYKKLRVFASCDSAEEVRKAAELSATGVGLLRTESLFHAPASIDLFRRVLLCDDEAERCKHLSALLPLQEEALLEVFRAMDGRPVTVRLLDAALQEFFPSPRSPSYAQDIAALAGRLGLPEEDVRTKVKALQEVNPMMGKRGCRLSILHPEITIMQTKALIGAALRAKQLGLTVKPHLVIPMVCSDHEVDCITPVLYKTWAAVCEEAGHSVNYLDVTFGSMVEVPRACLRAEKIAAADYVDFLCLGTTMLTQLVFGVSREDLQRFLPVYLEKHILAKDPFVDLDVPAVGSMLQLAVRKCRAANPAAKISVAGEHAGDPNSIRFFNKIGVDALSCAPFRVPVAKVAAAQAHIEETSNLSKLYYHPFHV